jgi:ATP-dependent DNA helicase RecQ
LEQAKDILNQYWGYDDFRSPQAEIVSNILDHKDCVVLLPTGGGKSICFQVPALMMEGLTLVVSPLIALMDDQVDNLRKRKIRAGALHSGRSKQEQELIRDNAISGALKLLYVSPEKLKSASFREFLGQLNLSMIAIDEAHCVSEWGHDFRPAYLDIPEIYPLVNRPLVAAFTATATPKVLEDLKEKLGLNDPRFFRSSFRRDNLSYHVAPAEHKFNRMCQMLNGSEGSVIVYMRSRRGTVHIADKLQKEGFGAEAYHAGMDFEQRRETQEKWIKGKSRIMVATSAFGMGIDKPDVRMVIHYEMPESLEAYIQEAGRAGRDGIRSYAIMLRTQEDEKKLKEKRASLLPPFERISTLYDSLSNQFQLPVGQGNGRSFDVDLDAFCSHFKFERREVNFALDFLAREGLLEEISELDRWSKLKFSLNGEALYAFQVEQDRYTPLVRYLLRAYEGITFEFREVHERRMAAALKMSVAQVKKQLQGLQRLGVIHYLPAPEKQRVRMIVGRQDSRYFAALEKSHAQLLKHRKTKFSDSMKYLLRDDQCRERTLLAYFGEKVDSDCGKCDHCHRNSQRPDMRIILDLLSDKSYTLDELSVDSGISSDLLRRFLVEWEKEGVLQIYSDGKIGLRG